LSSGFYMETNEGNMAELQFNDHDDLVVMLGDGVNQYINDKLPASVGRLRAVPHALRLAEDDKPQQGSSSRVWYGRMVLPPVDAVHPLHGDNNVTFGQLRQQMMLQASSSAAEKADDHVMSLGCSNHRMARELTGATTHNTTSSSGEPTATSCASNALFCWYQCMDFADYNVTTDACAQQNQTLVCRNPRAQFSNGSVHGDYYPGCLPANAPAETPFPTLADYPRSNATCTSQGFMEFVHNSTMKYDHSVELMEGVAVLMWSIVNETAVDVRLAFNGIFGWLAFGLANQTGYLNGMLGAVRCWCVVRTVVAISFLTNMHVLLFSQYRK
jgi:hypothetical protein